MPYSYTFEGDVEDVSRQHIANRASFTVHPAPWYIGIRRPPYFVEQKNGLKTAIVAVTPGGASVPNVPVTVTLTQVQWLSVRRAEGNGFYTWDTERKEIPAGTWTVTTAADAAPLEIPIPNGGYFLLDATAREKDGRFAVTRTSFYALGDGYTAWARFDHNRIELVPEKKTYRPGETARIMIQSPWEQATALVTTEREGIRSHRQFTLTSTQESITIPITESDIPNVFVSVLLIKGRSQAAAPAGASPTGGPYAIEDTSDPGKPAFRLGYVELQVEDASKRLGVTIKANKEEYRPANTANVVLSVKDRAGRGTRSEVTLWAVDYGVLSLTAYQTPDVLKSVYVDKSLQVLTADSRQRIVSRRVLTPKGDSEGGGGGGDSRRGHAAQGLPRPRVLARLGDHRRERRREGRRQAPRIAHDVSHHGGCRRSRLAVRFGRRRSPHQQAADAEADVSAIPRRRRSGALRCGRDESARVRRRGRGHDQEPRSGCPRFSRRDAASAADGRERIE